MQDLDTQLLQAHAAQDSAQLARLYAQAATAREQAGDTDAACFYLTHAYVFALDCGAPSAAELNRRLVAYGRDDPQDDLR